MIHDLTEKLMIGNPFIMIKIARAGGGWVGVYRDTGWVVGAETENDRQVGAKAPHKEVHVPGNQMMYYR